MIINGGSRAKQTELARHLLRADTNETVRVFDLSGVVADDLMGALSEMAAIASGSRSGPALARGGRTRQGKMAGPKGPAHAQFELLEASASLRAFK